MNLKNFLFGEKRIAQTVPSEELLPHEIFPDIIYWEEGDNVFNPGLALGYVNNYTFIGVLDGLAYFRALRVHTISSLPLGKLGEVRNYAANERKADKQTEEIRNKIKLTHYYEVKKILQEKGNESFEEWLPKQIEK